jgi:tripartite-type tricarboxylate transporter receptor subunit TctC
VHFAGELLAHEAGVKLNHVPFKGANQSVEAVVGGHVPSSVSAVSSTLTWIKSGRVRVLGVMAPKRSSLLPDVPTFPELGYKTIVSDTWLGLIGPANIPEAVAGRLNDELLRILAQPDFAARVLATGNEPVGMGLDSFRSQMEREHEGYVRMIKAADIKPQ